MNKKLTPKPNRLRELREQSKLTQGEVGKLLDIAPETVAHHESGRVGIPHRHIEAYARIFKVRSYELFMAPEKEESGD